MTQVRDESPPPEAATQPAPGCVLVTAQGIVQQPLPGSGGGAGAGWSQPASGFYLMSDACVSNRQPAHGAVR